MNETQVISELTDASAKERDETRLFDAVIQTPDGKRFIISGVEWSYAREQVVFLAQGLPSEKVVK